MRGRSEATVTVAAPLGNVLEVASDANLVADWSGGWRDWVPDDTPKDRTFTFKRYNRWETATNGN